MSESNAGVGEDASGDRLIRLVSHVVIVALAVLAPALNYDDAAFFNYVNNVVDARPLYYYNGYVHVVPQLVSYALSGLPLVAQVLLYRVVPLITALWLYREAARVLMAHLNRQQASMLALAIVLVLRVAAPNVWATLSFAMWSALLAATFCIVRTSAAGERYSALAMVAVWLTAVTFSPGVLLLPIMVGHALIAGRGGLRRQNLLLAGGVTLAQLWLLREAPNTSWNPELSAAFEQFIDGFRDQKLANLTILGSLTVLAAGAALSFAGLGRRAAFAPSVATLTYLGWAWAAAYVVSERFHRYEGNFLDYYTVPALGCALLALAIGISVATREESRSLLTGVFLGAAIALGVAGMSTELRGPLELALMKYRFIQVAAQMREHCQPQEMQVFEDDESSPVLFCSKRHLPPGDFHLTNFSPTVGGADPGGDVDSRPFVLSPRPFVLWPLFGVGGGQ